MTQSHKITLIPGDGIGPEVTQAAVRILEATGIEVRVGNVRRRRRGLRKIPASTFPRSCIESIERNRVA